MSSIIDFSAGVRASILPYRQVKEGMVVYIPSENVVRTMGPVSIDETGKVTYRFEGWSDRYDMAADPEANCWIYEGLC